MPVPERVAMVQNDPGVLRELDGTKLVRELRRRVVGAKRLDHIRYMRINASAVHPHENES